MTTTLRCSKDEVLSDQDGVVYLVGEDASGQEAVAAILRANGVRVITFESANEFRRRSRAEDIGCLILDLILPDSCGLELQRENAREGGPPVVFVTKYRDVDATVRAMKAGAIEFLTQPVVAQTLLAAVTEAFAEDRSARARLARATSLHQRMRQLTPREREVFPLVVSGLRNKQAAWQLGISEVTLQVHRGQIMRKMAAGSFAELVRMADQLNLDVPTNLVRPQRLSVTSDLALA